MIMTLLSTLIGVCAILALLLGLLPSLADNWPAAFLGGIRAHLAAAALLFSLSLLFLARSAWLALPLAASGMMCLWVWHLNERTSQSTFMAEEDRRRLKVIEFNILRTNRNGAEIARWLEEADADIIYTLESRPLADELSALSKVYPYRAGCGVLVSACDMMVMSKFPLDRAQFGSMGRLYHNRFLQAAISVNGTHLTIVAMHLAKPYFDVQQSKELRSAAARLKKIEGPIIVAGDFNSSLLSPDIQSFLMQTGLRSYWDEPRTWPVNAPALGLPIDHIFVRSPAYIERLDRIEDNMGSNHYGLEAEVSLPSLADSGISRPANSQ